MGGQAQRRSAQAQRGRLRETPCTRGERSSFHVFLQALCAGRFLSLPRWLGFVWNSKFHWAGNRATFSDSRSNFHTRIGYRKNVCRRRLASDLARASGCTPAQGAHEDHHDRPPGSPPEKVETKPAQVVIGVRISW